MTFLELIEKDPERLTEITQAEYARLGGMEGAEVIMWLVMRGAMSANLRKVHQTYYLPSMTGIATAIYENEVIDAGVNTSAAHRAHIGHQLAGAEKLEGTYPFTLARSVKGYRLNKFLHRMIEPAHRAKFLADEDASMREAGLTAEECDMIKRRDWRALIRYGASFFMLEKLGAVIGVSNLHIYAAMRGETLEAFQKTRNTQVLYSVAGTDLKKAGWDSAQSKTA
jgi:gallate dioxygenase